MIIGEKNLKKLFPNFEKDIDGNGIDLRVGKLYENIETNKVVGCIDDEKYLPKLKEVGLEFSGMPLIPNTELSEYYRLKPLTYYTIEIDREIYIPHTYTQMYEIRSTFARCGLILSKGVGDDGFNGTLRFGLFNATRNYVYIGKNERIVQAITFKNDGTTSYYDGSYQDNEIYMK